MAKDKKGSVLIVGGGIAGIQSSLDLANSGFKVYLVEKGPSIGGVMSQLDKTFPTNDCAMCILAPKLVGTGRHPNIELITNAEIEEVMGEAGNFTVAVKKNPRYVDEDKCTGCGACTENCPVKKAIYPVEEKIEIKLEPEDLERMKKIIEEYKGKEGALVPVLHNINVSYSYLPENILRYISEELDMPLSLIYQIATFYNAFSLKPRGKYTIDVCLGTACYIKGGNRILEAFERALGIKVGNTTEDLMFGIETISCFGCCGQAPVVVINEDLHGHFRITKVPKLIKSYKEVGNAEVEA
ncbi:NAD(P)H-dependent oxidoreductase subunit E [candidate division WOR-3 bacterium]|nr:NAD(P)H-dependent oxidoreductase subunit E [candidate division WOR-3 bacterium]